MTGNLDDLRALFGAFGRTHQQLLDEFEAAVRADALEDGVRQAMTWLRADYPYGQGPQWREDGAEWIADRLADLRKALGE